MKNSLNKMEKFESLKIDYQVLSAYFSQFICGGFFLFEMGWKMSVRLNIDHLVKRS
jgi:hypothetical protein